MRQQRTDAELQNFLALSLTAYDNTLYETQFADAKFRTLIPVDNQVPRGAQEVAFDVYTAAGMAAWLTSDARDIPRVTGSKERFTTPIQRFGVYSRYTDDDVERNMLEQQMARAMGQASRPAVNEQEEIGCVMAIEQFHETVAALGDAELGIYGFTTQPNISSYTIPNGAASSPLWANKTPDEILKDMNGATHYQVSNVKDNAMLVPDTMALPLGEFNRIATTARSSTSDTSILEWFLKNQKYIKNVIPWSRLDTAGPSSGAFGAVYRRNPMILKYRTSNEHERKPPERQNMGFNVFHVATSGGVTIHFPVGVTKFTGF